MITTFKSRPSLFTFLVLCFVVVACRILLPLFHLIDIKPILSGDVFGHYLYLPAYFIHHDTGLRDFSWVRNVNAIYHLTTDFYQASSLPTGEYVMRFPLGMAILYTPFFFAGWLFAYLSGYPIDGFSYPFQVALIAGSLICTFTGLWFLRKILLKFFNESITAITMILVVLGTNYFQLVIFEGAMPDNCLFTLFAVITWLTIRWQEKPEWKFAVSAGVITGLSILVRPSALVILLIPVFWGICDKTSANKKWNLIKENKFKVILFFTYLIMVVFFQMIYLKLHSGRFDFNTHAPGEKLQWIGPWLPQLLFSFKKGWLIYTPLMLFPVIGYFFLAEKLKEIFYATFLFFIVFLLITASWSIWWDNDSFGQRSMIGSYAILSLPMGFFVAAMAKRKSWQKISISVIIGCFILLNLFQTWQYQEGVIHPSKMTAEYYLRIFGQVRMPPGSAYFLEGMEDNEKELLKLEHFTVSDPLVRIQKGILILDSTRRFSPGVNFPIKEIYTRNIKGLRITALIYSKYPIMQNPCHIVMTLFHKGMNYRYRSYNLEDQNVPVGKWRKFSMDYLISEKADTNYKFLGYIWYTGRYEILVDDLKFDILKLSDK